MSAGKKQRFWQPRPCPSWCNVRHYDSDPIRVRECLSDWVGVDRPRLNPILDDGSWRVRRVGVRLRRGVIGMVTWVDVCNEIAADEYDEDGKEGPCFRFAVSEALDVAEAIRQAACAASNDGLPKGFGVGEGR